MMRSIPDYLTIETAPLCLRCAGRMDFQRIRPSGTKNKRLSDIVERLGRMERSWTALTAECDAASAE